MWHNVVGQGNIASGRHRWSEAASNTRRNVTRVGGVCGNNAGVGNLGHTFLACNSSGGCTDGDGGLGRRWGSWSGWCR
jgi:hypothetical protein